MKIDAREMKTHTDELAGWIEMGRPIEGSSGWDVFQTVFVNACTLYHARHDDYMTHFNLITDAEEAWGVKVNWETGEIFS